MKKSLVFVMLCALTASTNFISAQSNSADFNGDGKTETCYLQKPKFTEPEEETMPECIGECTCFIKFSDSNIPAIKIEKCIGGTPEILGDLDGNGTTEIGITPDWWTSCWRSYYVYTFANGKWQLLVKPFSTHCNLFDDLEKQNAKIIEPVPGKSDMFIIRYSKYHEKTNDIVTTTTVADKLPLE